jgi:hypothetical protein
VDEALKTLAGFFYVAGWIGFYWGKPPIRSGSVLRIGTDDPMNLARFLEGKIA